MAAHAGIRSGEWSSNIAVLAEGDIATMAGDRQHLLAGRASCGLGICLPHLPIPATCMKAPQASHALRALFFSRTIQGLLASLEPLLTVYYTAAGVP